MKPRHQQTPIPVIPTRLIRRFRAKQLYPSARKAHNTPAIRPTAYVQDTILVPGTPQGTAKESIDLLSAVGETMGFTITVEDAFDDHLANNPALSEAASQQLEQLWVTKVRLHPCEVGQPVDAWWVIQTMRQAQLHNQLSLDHLVFAAPHVSGHPYIGASAAIKHDSHHSEHTDGPLPVTMIGLNPATAAAPVHRAPHVVVIDTVLGDHEWFDNDPTVVRQFCVANCPLGLGGPFSSGQERVVDLSGSWPPLHGHATFVAGIVRQRCPQARLSMVPLLDDDGVATESALLHTLALLCAEHVGACDRGDTDAMIDVINLSLGYYHEQPTEPEYSAALRRIMTALGEWGVSVVAAAGNQASSAPWWPAAFSGATAADRVSTVSVGALDTDTSAVAWFTNSGPWVTCYRPGVNVMSSIDREVEVSADVPPGWPQHVGFPTGFALWSGTSFAAPVFAGELAAHFANTDVTLDSDREKLVERAVAGQRRCLGNPATVVQ